MRLNEYQELSKRTMPKDDLKDVLSNYGLGLSGEAGEVSDLIKKKLFHQHKSISVDDFKNELGDVLHYVAGIATALNISLEDVANANLEKLRERYPNGFNPEDSMKRVDTNK